MMCAESEIYAHKEILRSTGTSGQRNGTRILGVNSMAYAEKSCR
jgi:hypothetical protein